MQQHMKRFAVKRPILILNLIQTPARTRALESDLNAQRGLCLFSHGNPVLYCGGASGGRNTYGSLWYWTTWTIRLHNCAMASIRPAKS